MLRFFYQIDRPLVWLMRRLAARRCPLGPWGAFRLDCRVDTWLRHRWAVRKVVDYWCRRGVLAPCRVIDVGGSGDLAAFLPGIVVETANVTADADVFCRGAEIHGSTAAYDVAVCLDTLEHVAVEYRAAFLDELRRLVRPGGLVLLHFPADGAGLWAAADADRRFQQWHRALTGRDEPNIAEHQEAAQYPGPLWPGGAVGRWSVGRWVRVMLAQRIPFLRLLVAGLYGMFPGRAHQEPPYYAVAAEVPV